MEIHDIDSNLKVEKTLGVEDIVFRDVREEPFDVYGFYDYRNQRPFKRIPDDVARATNEGVAFLFTNTAGGRVRFTTDSPYVAIRCKMPTVCRFEHMPLTGTSGFDLYVNNKFRATFIPPFDMTDGYESLVWLGEPVKRELTVHFPLYNDVSDLWVGVRNGSYVEHGNQYLPLSPVVYYGSSITQGGCASRPGNAYQNIITRRLNVDHINLGFSGSGRGEEAIVRYMAGLDMCAFVSDYDHNAPNAEHLLRTHYPLYRAVRDAHPDIPYIIVSRPDFRFDPMSSDRRDAVYATYRRALAEGDRRCYYIDGESMFRGPDEDMCTVDGCHPNDRGFALMADAIGCVLSESLSCP